MLQGSSSAAFQEAKDWALQLMATSKASGDAAVDAKVQNLLQDASIPYVPVKAAGQPHSLCIKQPAVASDASGSHVAQIISSQAANTNMVTVASMAADTGMAAATGVAAQSGAGMLRADAATVLGPATPSGPTFRETLDNCGTRCAHNPANASDLASVINPPAPGWRQDSEQTSASDCQKAAPKQAVRVSTSNAEKPQKSVGFLQWLGAAAMPACSEPPHTASASSGHHSEARHQTAALSDGDLTAPEQTTEGEQSCGVAVPMLIDDMALEPTPSCHQSQAINLIDCLRPQSRSAVMVTAGSPGAAATCIQPEPGSPPLQLSCPAQAPTSSTHPYLSNALPAALDAFFAQNITQLAKQTGTPAMAVRQASLSDTAIHNPVRSSVPVFRADAHTQPSQKLPLGDLLCANAFSQAAPCIPAHTPSPAPTTQVPGGPCLGLLNAIREKPQSASDQGFLIALNSCSVNTVTKQPNKGLASCPVPMMGASGSPAIHAAALQPAPFCLPLPKASGLLQEPWDKAESCLSASIVPFCPSRVYSEPTAAGFGHNPTAHVTPQVYDACNAYNLA